MSRARSEVIRENRLPTYCQCDRESVVLDYHGISRTEQCRDCGYCSLVIDRRPEPVLIRLCDFHRTRGDDYDQRPFHELRMAEQLVNCLTHDVWPSSAAVVDFGIATDRHRDALQHAVRTGFSAYDLDRVTGEGPAITQLVRAAPGQQYADLEFRTAYDDLHTLPD